MKPGDLIKDWLKKEDMRREQLAARVQVSIGTLNNFLAGKRIGYPTIIALAHVTGIPEADLLSRGNRPRRAS